MLGFPTSVDVHIPGALSMLAFYNSISLTNTTIWPIMLAPQLHHFIEYICSYQHTVIYCPLHASTSRHSRDFTGSVVTPSRHENVLLTKTFKQKLTMESDHQYLQQLTQHYEPFREFHTAPWLRVRSDSNSINRLLFQLLHHQLLLLFITIKSMTIFIHTLSQSIIQIVYKLNVQSFKISFLRRPLTRPEWRVQYAYKCSSAVEVTYNSVS